jgi:hypothetical protein
VPFQAVENLAGVVNEENSLGFQILRPTARICEPGVSAIDDQVSRFQA